MPQAAGLFTLDAMPVHLKVPARLRTGPFSAADARAAGVQRWNLDTSNYRRLGRDVYAWAGLADTPELKLAAALLHLPGSAVFSGLTAAWLHNLDSTFVEPVQVTLPAGHTVKARVGLRISRVRLARSEITQRNCWRVTSPVRTILDLSRRLPLIDAVILADVAVHRRMATLDSLRAAADLVPGSRNVQRIRRVLAHVEPKSESHMESRLRMLLVTAGLPRPQAQVNLHDAQGSWLGRVDLYYPSHRLAIEYDGTTHRTSLVEDNRRQNLILAAGYKLRRYTKADLTNTPSLVIAQVQAELSSPRIRPAPAPILRTPPAAPALPGSQRRAPRIPAAQ